MRLEAEILDKAKGIDHVEVREKSYALESAISVFNEATGDGVEEAINGYNKALRELKDAIEKAKG